METETETPEEQEVLVHEITDDGNVKPPSLADQLRARRSEIADAKTVHIPLTGYEAYGVTVMHRLMDRHEVEIIGRKIINETRDRAERNMRILLDVIINSTEGFYIRLDGADEPEPIQDDRNGNAPLHGWDGLALYLGWQPDVDADARKALYWVFGQNEFAIGQYGIVLNRWMGNTGVKVDEEFMGEML